MDDLRAVMDAAGIDRAALFGVSEGGPMCQLFAATHPDRATALALYGTYARATQADDYPIWLLAVDPRTCLMMRCSRVGRPRGIELFAPSHARQDRDFRTGGRGCCARVPVHTVLPPCWTSIRELGYPHGAGQHLGAPPPCSQRRDDVLVREPQAVVPWPSTSPVPATSSWMATTTWCSRATRMPSWTMSRKFFTGMWWVPRWIRARPRSCSPTSSPPPGMLVEPGDGAGASFWRAMMSWCAASSTATAAWVVKSLGDGFLATFDGPARAIRCAGAIREDVRRLGVEIRAGLHTGECEVIGAPRRDGGGHPGLRAGSRAEGGEVLVSSTVRDLVVGSGIEFADRGEHDLKGVPGRWRLFAATVLRPSAPVP